MSPFFSPSKVDAYRRYGPGHPPLGVVSNSWGHPAFFRLSTEIPIAVHFPSPYPELFREDPAILSFPRRRKSLSPCFLSQGPKMKSRLTIGNRNQYGRLLTHSFCVKVFSLKARVPFFSLLWWRFSKLPPLPGRAALIFLPVDFLPSPSAWNLKELSYATRNGRSPVCTLTNCPPSGDLLLCELIVFPPGRHGQSNSSARSNPSLVSIILFVLCRVVFSLPP